MAKLVAVYKQPEDKRAFDDHYFNVHAPLTEKIPGLTEMKVTTFTGTPMGKESPYYLMCEMTYNSMDDLKKGMGSDEGKASGKDLMSFAGNLVTLMISEEQ